MRSNMKAAAPITYYQHLCGLMKSVWKKLPDSVTCSCAYYESYVHFHRIGVIFDLNHVDQHRPGGKCFS